MALASYALVSWDTVKEQLEIDESEKTRAELVINAASETANRYAQRTLGAADYTEDIDGTGTRSIFVTQFPVNSVTAAYIDDDRAFGSDTEVTDYVLYDDIGKLTRPDARWTKGVRNVRVEYNAGYTTVPYEVQLAVLEVIAYNWRRRASQSIGVRSMSGDGVSTEFELTVPTNAQRVFESYRRRYL